MRKTIAALGALYLTFAFGTTAQAQAAINPNPIGVDPEHYQCYNVQGEPTAITIKSLADQFGKSQDLRVTGPTILCAPVSKNGELLAAGSATSSATRSRIPSRLLRVLW